jgi:hypothetical protein
MKTQSVTLLLICFCLLSSTAFAQFEFGIKGGGNFSKLTQDLDSDYRTGFHLGIFGELKAKAIGIQPELMFMTGGGETQQGIFNGDLRLDYLAVPVMVNFYPVSFLALQFGPQFMFNTLAELTSTVGGVSTSVLVEEHINQMQWAASVGIMAKLPLGFRLSGRYVAGYTNLHIDGQVEGKNDFIMISLGKSFF